MNLAFEIVINFLQGFMMIGFLQARIRPEKDYSHCIDIVYALAIGCVLTLYTLLPLPLPDTCVLLLPFAYTMTTHRGCWGTRVFWTAVLGLIMSLTVSLTAHLYEAVFHVSFDALLESTVFRVGFVVSVNTETIFLLLIIGRIRMHEAGLIPKSTSVMMLVLFILQFVSAEMLYCASIDTDKQTSYLIISSVCALGYTVVTCILYEYICRNAAKRHMEEMKRQTLLLNQKYQEDIQSVYKQMLIAQHDLQHQINTAAQLLSVGDVGKRQDIAECLKKASSKADRIVTGSIGVDAILTAKKAIAELNDTEFQVDLCPLIRLPLDETAFCVMLTNLLDNALDGTATGENTPQYRRTVDLRLNRVREMLYITCRNSYAPSAVRKSNPSGLHGLGMKSVRQIAEEHHGMCEFSSADGIFTAIVGLPFEDETD